MISSGTSETGRYPEPAASLAAALGSTNLDVLGLLPVGCVLPHVNFYGALIFKTIGVLMPVALLWLWPLVLFVFRKDSLLAKRFVGGATIIWMELAITSVSTSIVTTFVCDDFGGDQLFLRAQLTIACDDSNQRKFWVGYASVAATLYPLGVPALLFTLLYQNRTIIKSMMETMKQEQAGHTSRRGAKLRRISSTKALVRELSSSGRRPSFVKNTQDLSWLVKKFDKFTEGDRDRYISDLPRMPHPSPACCATARWLVGDALFVGASVGTNLPDGTCPKAASAGGVSLSFVSSY